MTSDLRRRDRVLRRLLRASLRVPVRVRRRIAGRPRVDDRGRSLDEEMHWVAFLDRLLALGSGKGDPARERANMRASVRLVEPAPAPVARCEDLEVGGVPARLYAPAADRPPVLVYLHGGGWVTGDLRTHDRLCRRLCSDLGWIVISVGYRLAPEHPFPAGREDAVAALRDVQARAADLGGDPERVAVGGDSAGGNLAALACLALRDAGGPRPWLQVLLYPATDLTRAFPSHQTFGSGLVLTSEAMDWYLHHYQAPATDPGASPLLAEDLSGLPPAVVLTAGFDPLRDEGEAYASRLAEAGVPVTHLEATGLVHGFLHMDGVLPPADREVARLVRTLREL